MVSFLKKSQDKSTSKRISQLYQQRKNILKDIFHQLSRLIVNYAIQHGIDKIVIGYNQGQRPIWKRRSRLAGSMNRIYNQIPFATLVKYVFHKGEEAGIIIVENVESYTSKCDALALESFDDCKRRTTNRRLVRGLYRSSGKCRC